MKKHGGIRPGAGRPVTVDATETLTFRVDKKTSRSIGWLATFQSVSKAEVIRRAILEEMLRHKPITCKKCGKLFKNKLSLNIHLGHSVLGKTHCYRYVNRRKL